MAHFRALPVYKEIPGIFRYDPKGRGQTLVQPLILFLVSFVTGTVISVATGHPLEQPVVSIIVLSVALLSLFSLFIIKNWSIRQMNFDFLNWLRDEHGLVPMNELKLGDKGTHSFKSLRTEEVLDVEFFIGKQIVAKNFLKIPFALVYDTVMMDRITVPPTSGN